MKPALQILFVSLVTAGLIGGAYRSCQRERLFAEQGVPQTITIVEEEPSRLVALFPPRFDRAYSGRIGNVDARIETARRLRPGQTVAVRHLPVDSTAPLARLGGRTDRILARRSGGEAVWFAYGSPDASAVANLAADTPLPEGLFAFVCGLSLVAALLPGSTQTRRRPLRELRHPLLRPATAPEPAPGPASPRVRMPASPPPLPEPTAAEPEAALTLPRRSPPPSPRPSEM